MKSYYPEVTIIEFIVGTSTQVYMYIYACVMYMYSHAYTHLHIFYKMRSFYRC